jgi:hypothetical protein
LVTLPPLSSRRYRNSQWAATYNGPTHSSTSSNKADQNQDNKNKDGKTQGSKVSVQQITVLAADDRNSAVQGLNPAVNVATSGFDRLENGCGRLCGRGRVSRITKASKRKLRARVAPRRPPERRPDIAAAERTMAQANALIGVEKAVYYPTVSLTGGGLQGSSLARLFSLPGIFWSLGASASQILFDAGLRKATVARRRL